MTKEVSKDPPKVFISYSWSSDEHQQWVIKLATELRESGVDCVLDKWDLREGDDSHAFMEQMVNDSSINRVILICDAQYVEKANARSGGVGAEAQIISPSLYGKVKQKKFVAIVRERNIEGKPVVPAYYGARIHIEMTSEDEYAPSFEQLLRWIYDKPVHAKPSLGKPPLFLDNSDGPALANTVLHRRAIEAVREQKPNVRGLVREYFSSCVSGLEQFSIRDEGNPSFDEEVVKSIESFTPHRNALVELLSSVMQFGQLENFSEDIHKMFEGMLVYYDFPDSTQSYRDWDLDNNKFIVHELFLYALAISLRAERFDVVESLIGKPYYLPENRRGPGKLVSFVKFREHLDVLEHRGKRLNLRRLSVHADMLQDRCSGSGVEFRHLMQADFVLFLRSCVDELSSNNQKMFRQQWWPETLLFSSRRASACEVFSRAESRNYFDRIKPMLGIDDKEDLAAVLEGLKTEKLYTPSWQFERVNTSLLMGFDNLETRP